MPRRFIVRHGDEDTPVDVLDEGRVRVGVAGQVFSIAKESPGCYRASDGTHTWRVAVAGPPDSRYVGIDGVSACVEVLPRERSQAARPRAQPGGLTAPMPGTVIAIEVVPGRRVRAGDVLLTIEAMKMELPLRAPREGVVSAVRCAPGDLVQPGPPLIDIT